MILGWKALRAGLMLSALIPVIVLADMGRVSVGTAEANVNEASQIALILHNGEEEVLILGTELNADQTTPIIRFIPFPSEPEAQLAPEGIFDRLADMVAKYQLQFLEMHYSKGGDTEVGRTGVEIRKSQRLGAHDMTVIKVTEVEMFRRWVNDFLHSKKLPLRETYPVEEGIVADYVARGFVYFVVDYVEVPTVQHRVDPVLFRFKTKNLYYPLKTSNSFGGQGAIDLFVVAPVTYCAAGSNMFGIENYDKAMDEQGRIHGKCLGQTLMASTSVQLVPEEHDLKELIPDGDALFGSEPLFLQALHYDGPYQFEEDILIPAMQGFPQARLWSQVEQGALEHSINQRLAELTREFVEHPNCRMKPERGPCKGAFETFYFDDKIGACKIALWGGCQGVIPFGTLEDCEKACTPAELLHEKPPILKGE